MLMEEYILLHGTQSWREKLGILWQKGTSVTRPGFLVCWSCLMPLLPTSKFPWLHVHCGTVSSGLPLSSLAKEGKGPREGAEAWELQGGAGAGTGRCLCSFAHPSPPLSSPETSNFATTSIEDAELRGPGPGRGGSKGGCGSCQAINQADPSAQGSLLADSAPTSAVMNGGHNSTDLLVPGELGGARAGGRVTWPHVPPAGTWRVGLGSNTPHPLTSTGIPSVTQAWGLWALLGAVTLLLLISLAAHLSRWTSSQSRSQPGQGRSGGSVEEVPLYGNLHYLQTGRLSQEPGPNQQDPTPGGPARAAEEVMCYTSLQLRPLQGRTPSPGAPIKYSEVVLDSEPKPQASGPEPELYASVCAQTRRARASFPDQAYANSHPAPS
ncbi:hypothetical protein HPG69_011524 [Diceros bicornis minor]|uniref:Signaling threshold-regulating transmembrane adapter 1 n=1 Tax=Diceros bicornis minor TaxID=77932 RepID=A0A7J7EJ99_DICBM|nr:hypothetical protein HPG69_011524 [Diceros bicornis minor]